MPLRAPETKDSLLSSATIAALLFMPAGAEDTIAILAAPQGGAPELPVVDRRARLN